jgi:hypothetical protein
MYNYQQQYEDEQRRLALLPTITSTVLITVFFGLFGLIPAVSNTNRARALGVQTSKYWKAFGVTIAAVLVGWVLIFAAAGNSDSSTGYTGAQGAVVSLHPLCYKARNVNPHAWRAVCKHSTVTPSWHPTFPGASPQPILINPPPTQVTWTNPPPIPGL